SIDQSREIQCIRQVAVVQKHPNSINVRIFIEMINARCVERTRPANNAMYLVAFLEQQVCEIASVLAGDAGDECFLHAGAAVKQEPVSRKRKIRSETRMLHPSSAILLHPRGRGLTTGGSQPAT